MEKISKEWQEVLDMKPGQIAKDWDEDGVRVLVMRGQASLCAYVGIPTDHPLAGIDWTVIILECHGGCTYSEEGHGEGDLPKGYYWYGWDYAHLGDALTFAFDDTLPVKMSIGCGPGDKQWGVKEVIAEATEVAREFANSWPR